MGGTLAVFGRYVDGTWPVLGRYVDGTRTVLGRSVDGTCTVHGRYLDGTWTVLVRYMNGTWTVRGRYFNGTWPVLGRYLDGTWTVPRRYVDGTRRKKRLFGLTVLELTSNAKVSIAVGKCQSPSGTTDAVGSELPLGPNRRREVSICNLPGLWPRGVRKLEFAISCILMIPRAAI